MGIAGTFFIVTLTDMLRKSVPGSGGRTPAYRQSQQKRSQKVKTKRQPAPSTRFTKRTNDEETRSVPPRGSVIQQNMTKLASIATRSTATQTTHSVTDGRSLQQSRSIQGKYWLDLQRLQHSVQQIFQRTREPSRKLPARSPTAVLEQLRDRIRSISLDMDALDKSCSVETEIQQPSKKPRITASCCAWFRSTVDNSSFMKSVAQVRHFDRAPCVLCDTIRSRRCHRCSHCEGILHSEISLLVISSRAVDNLDTRMQAPEGLRTVHQTLHSSQPVPPPRRQPASKLPHSRHRCHRTRQAATCRSSQSLGNGHPTLHSLSLCPSLGRKT